MVVVVGKAGPPAPTLGPAVVAVAGAAAGAVAGEELEDAATAPVEAAALTPPQLVARNGGDVARSCGRCGAPCPAARACVGTAVGGAAPDAAAGAMPDDDSDADGLPMRSGTAAGAAGGDGAVGGLECVRETGTAAEGERTAGRREGSRGAVGGGALAVLRVAVVAVGVGVGVADVVAVADADADAVVEVVVVLVAVAEVVWALLWRVRGGGRVACAPLSHPPLSLAPRSLAPRSLTPRSLAPRSLAPLSLVASGARAPPAPATHRKGRGDAPSSTACAPPASAPAAADMPAGRAARCTAGRAGTAGSRREGSGEVGDVRAGGLVRA